MFKIIFSRAGEASLAHTSGANEQGAHMPYPAGHRAKVKKNIIDSARKPFNRHGFENVSLNQIMAGAGLTQGGFYSYFKSKSDLYSAVLGCFFTDPEWKNCWEGVHVDLSSTDVGPQIVRAYLSRQHFEDVENSCPMVALPTDVARSGVSAKRAFETVFKAMVSVLDRSLAQNGRRRRATAQGIAALSIGGMVVARTMIDRALADQLRAACISVALDLGGWDKKSKSADGRSKRPRSRGVTAS
jgi:TetR/AcrR family transcriptional regulator, transcriptional repressor for nem operon